MFYVYTYLRKDGTPYYVGKGKDDRAWYKGNHERIRKPSESDRIIIVENNLSEESAFALEIELIAKYGRKDLGTGNLHNRTDGGEGISGAKFGRPPEERIMKIAKTNTGKKRSEDTKQKLRDVKLGKKDSEETKLKKSKSASKPKSYTHRENIRNAKLGDKNPMYGKVSPKKDKPLSEDTKQKLRDVKLGKKDSEETRRKKSEAQKKRHAENKLKHNTGEIK
jgi:hypothetical protein